MAVKINIHQNLQYLTNSQDIVEVEGNTVGQCLDQLVGQFPAIKKELFDKNNKLLSYIEIYVNGESSYPEELAKSVDDGDELTGEADLFGVGLNR